MPPGLSQERELLERVPKEMGRGTVHHKMPGSTLQSHQDDASCCKAKGRCQSSVLKKPGIGGVIWPHCTE